MYLSTTTLLSITAYKNQARSRQKVRVHLEQINIFYKSFILNYKGNRKIIMTLAFILCCINKFSVVQLICNFQELTSNHSNVTNVYEKLACLEVQQQILKLTFKGVL